MNPRFVFLALFCALSAPGCESGSDTDNAVTGGGGSGGDAAPAAFHVTGEGAVIVDGGSYCTPLDACHEGNTVSMFSEQRTLFTLRNGSDQDVTIDRISLALHDGNMLEEWTLIDTELSPSPLAVDGQVIPAGGGIDFYPRFFPVESGERGCTVTVEYDGGRTYTFDIVGYGSYNSTFFRGGLPAQHRILSGAESDELPGGMVVGSDGSVYSTANVSQIIDGFTTDLMVSKIDAAGTLVWAKIWNGPYQDQSPDAGQNSETGGTADSIAMGSDGFIYVAGRTSQTNSNSTFYSLLLKIDPNDGALVWEKAWTPTGEYKIASDSSAFYGVHVDGDNVYATGTAHDNAHVSLVVFGTDGTLRSATAFELHDKENDRGYSVRTDGKGNAYIGGNGSGDAILLKVSGADTATPALAWAKAPGLGVGGNINSMDIDDDGNLYVAYDIRGASSHFVFGKVDPDGNPLWSKEYVGNNGDKNNVHVIRYLGGNVYAGGRTGPSLLDGQMGDGAIVKLDSDGGEIWTAEYFNGKQADELTEHRIKGLALHDGDLVQLAQVYTGVANYERYWGYWYHGSGSLADATITYADRDAAAVTDLTGNAALDASEMRNGWMDAPTTVLCVDAAEAVGKAPDGGVMIMRVTE